MKSLAIGAYQIDFYKKIGLNSLNLDESNFYVECVRTLTPKSMYSQSLLNILMMTSYECKSISKR